MRAQIRIVGGSLRGRKVVCQVHPQLRPTPDRVREALFNILRETVPDRSFIDVFAGTGVVGLEALSRGAAHVLFIERDSQHVQEIRSHVSLFKVAETAEVLKIDAYRWARGWQAPPEPVNIYISPPFEHIARLTDELLDMIRSFQEKAAPGSTIVVQLEANSKLDGHEAFADWEKRRYGRNYLLIWHKAND